MNILHIFTGAYDMATSNYVWTDLNNTQYKDIKSFFQSTYYAFLVTSEGDVNGKPRIRLLGNAESWVKQNLDAGNYFYNTYPGILYIVNSIDSDILNSFDEDTLTPIDFTSFPDLALPSVPWILDNNQIILGYDWDGFKAIQRNQKFKALMDQATSIIDRWEDWVEVGHATPDQKTLWGQWKIYRGQLREWDAKTGDKGKLPTAPSRTTPADISLT